MPPPSMPPPSMPPPSTPSSPSSPSRELATRPARRACAAAVLALAALAAPALAAAQAAAPAPPASLISPEEAERRAMEAEMCRQTACQRDLRITVRDGEGGVFDEHYDVFPAIVQDIGLLVVAGQQIHVEARVQGTVLDQPRAVPGVRAPARTLSARLEQRDDDTMRLVLEHGFDRPLRVRLGVMPLDADEMYEVPSCAVPVGEPRIVTLDYPVFQVLLGEPRLLADGEADGPDGVGACADAAAP
jgi:hypothetical protein